MTHKLLTQLERDIRNQVRINSFLRLNRRQKFMVMLNRFNWILMTGVVFCLLFWLALGSLVFAGELHVPCPTPGESCKILVLTPQEERLLTGQNGILDTAAQGRALDLGQFSVYLKTRIASAPAGEVQKAPEPPKPAENKPDASVDTNKK